MERQRSAKLKASHAAMLAARDQPALIEACHLARESEVFLKLMGEIRELAMGTEDFVLKYLQEKR